MNTIENPIVADAQVAQASVQNPQQPAAQTPAQPNFDYAAMIQQQQQQMMQMQQMMQQMMQQQMAQKPAAQAPAQQATVPPVPPAQPAYVPPTPPAYQAPSQQLTQTPIADPVAAESELYKLGTEAGQHFGNKVGKDLLNADRVSSMDMEQLLKNMPLVTNYLNQIEKYIKTIK